MDSCSRAFLHPLLCSESCLESTGPALSMTHLVVFSALILHAETGARIQQSYSIWKAKPGQVRVREEGEERQEASSNVMPWCFPGHPSWGVAGVLRPKGLLQKFCQEKPHLRAGTERILHLQLSEPRFTPREATPCPSGCHLVLGHCLP